MGAAYGLIVGFRLYRRHRRLWGPVKPYPEGREADISRALRKGRADEPEIAAAAIRLGNGQLERTSARHRILALVVLGFMSVGFGYLALAEEPWLWIICVLFAASIIWSPFAIRRLRERVAALTDANPSTARTATTSP